MKVSACVANIIYITQITCKSEEKTWSRDIESLLPFAIIATINLSNILIAKPQEIFFTKLRVRKMRLHFNIGKEKHASTPGPLKIFNKDSSMMWGECRCTSYTLYLSIIKFRQMRESERFIGIFLKALTAIKKYVVVQQ